MIKTESAVYTMQSTNLNSAHIANIDMAWGVAKVAAIATLAVTLVLACRLLLISRFWL